MRYVVIRDFFERLDEYHCYHAGDAYPRDGAEASEERIAELADGTNRCGKVYIKAVKEAKKKTTKKKVKKDAD